MFEIKLSDQVWNSCKNGNQLKAYYCQIILITGTSCEDVFVYSKFKTCVLMSNHILPRLIMVFEISKIQPEGFFDLYIHNFRL